jgi:hypothetical protein
MEVSAGSGSFHYYQIIIIIIVAGRIDSLAIGTKTMFQEIILLIRSSNVILI